MKKWIVITMFLCTAFFLFGCDQPATDSGEKTQDTIDTTTTTTDPDTDKDTDTDTDTDTTASDTATDKTTAPSDDEMASIFEDAYTVYQWFDLDPLTVETDSDGNVVFYSIDGNDYCEKVDDPAVSSLDELEDEVHQYFAPDLAETLLDDGRYFESDGVLYAIAADRGSDITRGDVISKDVTDRSDTSITFTVTVETLNPETGEATGSEDIDYQYELIDGDWVFTTFESIY